MSLHLLLAGLMTRKTQARAQTKCSGYINPQRAWLTRHQPPLHPSSLKTNHPQHPQRLFLLYIPTPYTTPPSTTCRLDSMSSRNIPVTTAASSSNVIASTLAATTSSNIPAPAQAAHQPSAAQAAPQSSSSTVPQASASDLRLILALGQLNRILLNLHRQDQAAGTSNTRRAQINSWLDANRDQIDGRLLVSEAFPETLMFVYGLLTRTPGPCSLCWLRGTAFTECEATTAPRPIWSVLTYTSLHKTFN